MWEFFTFIPGEASKETETTRHVRATRDKRAGERKLSQERSVHGQSGGSPLPLLNNLPGKNQVA